MVVGQAAESYASQQRLRARSQKKKRKDALSTL